jgi:hypothetical protein
MRINISEEPSPSIKSPLKFDIYFVNSVIAQTTLIETHRCNTMSHRNLKMWETLIHHLWATLASNVGWNMR